MQLTNETPFSPFIFEAYGQRDELLHAVFCRGTFDIQADGTLTLADEQQPAVLADQYRNEPLVSSVQVDTDLVPHKFNADITLNAIAHAPHGKPSKDWLVNVRVGKVSQSLRVTGPRRWEYSMLTGWQLTPPEPTLSVPIHFEYAFGGKYLKEEEEVIFEQNPVGRGSADPHYADRSQPVPAPQIEYPNQPITRFGKTYPPAGLGPVAKHWLPRRTLCGTADQHWKETRWPLRPLDFDFNYYNSAPPGLVYPGYLVGTEDVSIDGCSIDGNIAFQLPKVAVAVILVDDKFNMGGGKMRLDTLHIDTVEGQAYLTWHFNWKKESDLFLVNLSACRA